MLRTSDLEYDLPAGRIATRPAEPRDAARLMVVDRAGRTTAHRRVRDLGEFLRAGDLLVMNVSRVLAARFVGVREDTGGGVEGLYLREADGPGSEGEVRGSSGGAGGGRRWVAMVRSRRFREGMVVRLSDARGGVSAYRMRLVERVEGAEWVVEVERGEGACGSTPGVLAEIGLPPLPPYILSARRGEGAGRSSPGGAIERGDGVGPASVWDGEGDLGSYQTVFAGGLVASADGTEVGSVAAPTAGLHFTAGLLADLEARGIGRAEVVLHVGAGTFRPVESEYVEQHAMHAEWCSMSAGARRQIAQARARGGRVVCVGTTSARTVEAFAEAFEEVDRGRDDALPGRAPGPEAPARGEGVDWLHTRLLVTPGYRWRWTDALLTNFHLPRSTLMALVAALLPGGVDDLKRLYAEAIGEGYRFYSYGDAMLVV